jgi:alpha(1,3/1,4) fucosyltransferase
MRFKKIIIKTIFFGTIVFLLITSFSWGIPKISNKLIFGANQLLEDLPNKPNDNMVYLYPGYFGLQQREGEDVWLYGINLSELCRERGLTIKVVYSFKNLESVHKIIVFEIVNYNPSVLKVYPSEKLSLFLWEPPVVLPKNYMKENHKYFSKIFTWDDNLVDNDKYFKFYYPELKNFEPDLKPFSEKKLCTLIARNKSSSHPMQLYSARIDAIDFFETHAEEEFDLFGVGWEGSRFKSYRGPINSKDVLKNYKFSLCYENGSLEGYVTEKIFDSFRYLCVPVYLGARNITDYVPENCFIDRRKFDSNEELLNFMHNMTEKEYLIYQQNIKNFLNSKEAQKFSTANFERIFKEALDYVNNDWKMSF